jgi:fatty acid-binding protein DegV
LICARPIERLAILHTMAPDIAEFTAEVIKRSGVDPSSVTVSTVGPSVGPHLGPGCVGAAVLYKR